MAQIKYNSFDESKERAEQDGSEWIFGAIQTDLAAVPMNVRLQYLPAGVLQFNNLMDTNGCASRGPNNILETKLDWFYDNGMHHALKDWFDKNGYRVNGKFVLCDAYLEILSGTTPTGNSLKAPVDALRKYGAIPASMIPLKDGMTWAEYMDPSRITPACKKMGAEFLRRITINYEQVPLAQFNDALNEDAMDVALAAWGPEINGVYQDPGGGFNHVVDRFTNEIDVFDNYEPFIKRLSKDYRFFEWGYSISITMQNPYPDEELALFEVLQKYGLLAFFAEAYKRLIAS